MDEDRVIIRWEYQGPCTPVGVTGVDPEIVALRDLGKWAKRTRKRLQRGIQLAERAYEQRQRAEAKAARKSASQTAAVQPAQAVDPVVVLAAINEVFPDRSAGRWCAHCGQNGSHHSDRHDHFAQFALAHYNGAGDSATDSQTGSSDGGSDD